MKAENPLIKESFKAGLSAYGKFNCAPASNAEFMKMVPNCLFEDEVGVRLRIAMYKEYIRGWHYACLNQPVPI